MQEKEEGWNEREYGYGSARRRSRKKEGDSKRRSISKESFSVWCTEKQRNGPHISKLKRSTKNKNI